MAYKDKLDQSKDKVYNHAIATKILDLMDKLRLDNNHDSSRRWVWELLQNAKDVAYQDLGISVEIELTILSEDEGTLEFRHNGKTFSIDNLSFLIQQVSTKERVKSEDSIDKTTGKFGTGFLTTHLLSETVEIEGIIGEQDEPYRKFKLMLDRSGKDISTIIESVNKSITSIRNISNQNIHTNYNREHFNTIFRYHLDKKGIEVATRGLDDLKISLPYVLVSLPEIKSVLLNHDDIKYRLLSERKLDQSISIHSVGRQQNNITGEITLVAAKQENVSVITKIQITDDIYRVARVKKQIPKLFCDFPLIGTEDFSFPMVINSHDFYPNKPRNGVYLTDIEDEKILSNKAVINTARELYESLLNYVSQEEWKSLYNLLDFSNVKEEEWLSKSWYKENARGDGPNVYF